jgi:hypothetical protein
MKLNVGEDPSNPEQLVMNSNGHGHYSNNIQVVNKNSELKNHRIRVTKLYLKSDSILSNE